MVGRAGLAVDVAQVVGHRLAARSTAPGACAGVATSSSTTAAVLLLAVELELLLLLPQAVATITVAASVANPTSPYALRASVVTFSSSEEFSVMPVATRTVLVTPRPWHPTAPATPAAPPPTSAASLAHWISGCTRWMKAPCAKPQSVPASTFSRPTTFASRDEPLGDEVGVLDDVGVVGHHARGSASCPRAVGRPPTRATRARAAGSPARSRRRRRGPASTRSTTSRSGGSKACGPCQLPQQTW